MKTDAAMHPGDDENQRHQPYPGGPRHPERIELLRIEFFMIEQRLAEPHADDMGDDEHGDAQAKHELQRLDRFPAKLPALVERPDPEAGVSQRRAVEHDRHRRKSPEQDVVINPSGERFHRDIAERMVEEMADQIGKQYEAAAEAAPPDADATEQFCRSFFERSGHAIQSNVPRQ